MTDYRGDRYFSRPITVEYEHTLMLYSEDLCRIFNVAWDEHIHWFIQDIESSVEYETNGVTIITCADDRTGEIIFQKRYDESYKDNEIENHFYAIIMQYVVGLGYDFGPLVVNIQTPKDPIELIDGALLKLTWTTFKDTL